MASPTPGLPRDLAAEELPAEQGDLDRRLASALERAGHALRVLIQTQATANGLSPIQVQLLLRLTTATPQRHRVGTLAAEFDLSAATVSEALATLRRKGLIEKQPLPHDKRGHILVATEAGRHTAQVLEHWPDPVTDHLSRVGAPEKAATLKLILDLIAELADTGVLSIARTCTTCRYFGRDHYDDAVRPHHCALLNSPLGNADLRVDCAEHQQTIDKH